MTGGCVIHWFRKGLRLHDNPALTAALKPSDGKTLAVMPVFILDPEFVRSDSVGPNRWRFLIQSLQDLDDNLEKLGSKLFVIRGNPREVFTDLFTKWDVKRITWELDTEPYSIQRDSDIETLAKERKVKVETFTSHTLFHPEQIIAKNRGDVPMTYQKYCTLFSSMGPPPKPLDAPDKISEEAKPLKELAKNQTYDIPTLDEVGINKDDHSPCLYFGGESEGLKRLQDKISPSNATWVRKFEKPQTSPNSLAPSTTVLSPYLKFGCVSVRLMYWKVDDLYRGSKHTQPPVSLHGQLLWREFFYTVGFATPNFDLMEGNPVARQIPWADQPHLLEAWENARTGFPWIDAIMTQLHEEGWIHHLARHSVACFLTRGDLWQSWVKGQQVFEKLLLDADWSLNAANWMWLSASAFFHQYYRVYSPIAFGKKTDENGDYIRKYIPVLAKFPAKYIYQPWEAPLATQKAAGCIIGVDYPRPIVDHAIKSKENLAKMKAAYASTAQQKDETPNKRKQPIIKNSSQKKPKA